MAMNQERYTHLMNSDDSLTPEELEEGWHFCYEWDGLLIHPDDVEYGHCTCSGIKPEWKARGLAALQKDMDDMERYIESGMYGT